MAYDGFYLTYKSDKETNERFDKITEKYPNFRLVKINLEDWSDPKVEKAINKIATVTNTKHFWVIDPDVKVDDDFDFDFETNHTNDDIPHMWNCDERNVFRSIVGVKLFRTKNVKEFGDVYIRDTYYQTSQFFEHETNAVEYLPTKSYYDIFYWQKGYGRDNLKDLQDRFDINVVEGETSIDVHKKCRELARTEHYYLVMPDTNILPHFKFDYSFEFGLDKENQKVVVWQKKNPITGFAREYNGVGLFPKDGPLFSQKEYDIFNFKKKAVYEKEPASSDLEFPVITTADMHTFLEFDDPSSDMYWVVHPDVEDFTPNFYPMSYDREYIHNFNIKLSNGKEIRNGIRLIPTLNATKDKQKDVDKVLGMLSPVQRIPARTIEEAIPQATGNDFWMVNPDLDHCSKILDEFYPDLYDTGPTHLWKFSSRNGDKDMGYGGLAFSNVDYHAENIIFHDEFAMKIPYKHNIKKYYTRDPYKAYKAGRNHTFYWVVDTVVDIVEDFTFDYYPDIFSIENVFAFKSEGEAGAGVYLVHRPHLESFNPSEEDFSFDRFKNIIRVDQVASRVTGHPAFFFDEGMYKENTEKYKDNPNIEIIDATEGLSKAYMYASKLTNTGYFWAIDNDAEVTQEFDRTFYVDRHHKSHFHVWPQENPYTGFVHKFGGLKLIPSAAINELQPDDDKLRKMTFKNKKPVKAEKPATRDIQYDVVMLSYQEPEADVNYAKLLEKVPNAKRVHGVKGIFNAHKRAAEIADTKMFYVIDADAILLDEFKFEYFPTVWDEDTVHVWKSKNPINGLIYGFGGLKLFPTQLLRDAKEWRIDFTTSISEKFKPMPIPANYTAFNVDPFNTWKSAFRECTKLSSSVIHRNKQEEDDERLETWCTVNSGAPFGEYAVAGAIAGRKYGSENAEDDIALGMINDFAWLKKKFEEDNNE